MQEVRKCWEMDEHIVCFGFFSCVLLTQTSKQKTHALISLSLLLSMFVSHPPALPLLSFSIFCSLPPSPPSKGHLHHLFLPAGQIFCFFVFFFFSIRDSAVKRLILLTTSERPAAGWDTAVCGRRGRVFWGYISSRRRRRKPGVGLPVFSDQERMGRWS